MSYPILNRIPTNGPQSTDASAVGPETPLDRPQAAAPNDATATSSSGSTSSADAPPQSAAPDGWLCAPVLVSARDESLTSDVSIEFCLILYVLDDNGTPISFIFPYFYV